MNRLTRYERLVAGDTDQDRRGILAVPRVSPVLVPGWVGTEDLFLEERIGPAVAALRFGDRYRVGVAEHQGMVAGTDEGVAGFEW